MCSSDLHHRPDPSGCVEDSGLSSRPEGGRQVRGREGQGKMAVGRFSLSPLICDVYICAINPPGGALKGVCPGGECIFFVDAVYVQK